MIIECLNLNKLKKRDFEMSDRIVVQVISILILMMILSVLTIDLTLKNKLKPAIILTIIIGLLCILELGIMYSHGLIPHNDNLIPKN